MVLNTRDLMKKYKIKPTRSLGQNFLIDQNVIKNIVDGADINERDLVIEVGPGMGDMTRALSPKAGCVIAVEIDKYLIPVLKESLQECTNTRVINEDILDVTLPFWQSEKEQMQEKCSGNISVKVVANLPYYITTPIIMKFLEEKTDIDAMVFMVQKEVADRMQAKPGGKEYGALSVAVQYYSKPEKLFDVSPQCFFPQPGVVSSVIRLNVYKTPPVQLNDQALFFKTVKAAFGQRRKTLVNALSNSGYFIEGKEEIKKILEEMGIDQNRRGETLSIMQFAELANAFSLKNSTKTN